VSVHVAPITSDEVGCGGRGSGVLVGTVFWRSDKTVDTGYCRLKPITLPHNTKTATLFVVYSE